MIEGSSGSASVGHIRDMSASPLIATMEVREWGDRAQERVIELKAIRDQARADAERAEGVIDRLGPSITPQALKTFASQARRRMRIETGGGYRRDHLRGLVQRIEVDAKEIRIIGSKGVLLRTLVAV